MDAKVAGFVDVVGTVDFAIGDLADPRGNS
jgi:hypothetical protein